MRNWHFSLWTEIEHKPWSALMVEHYGPKLLLLIYFRDGQQLFSLCSQGLIWLWVLLEARVSLLAVSRHSRQVRRLGLYQPM